MQVSIARDQRVDEGRPCTGQDPQVVGIPNRDWVGYFRSRDDFVRAQQLLDFRYPSSGQSKALVKDSTKLIEHNLADHQLVLRQYEPKKIRAQSASCDGTGDNVGVEKHSHDTSRKTSSSVR